MYICTNKYTHTSFICPLKELSKEPYIHISKKEGEVVRESTPKRAQCTPQKSPIPSKEPCIRNCRKEGEVVREYTLERALHITQKSSIYPQKNPIYTIVGRGVGS